MKIRLGNPHIKPLLALVTAVIILALPFIRQPFNQDDRDFVEFARVSAEGITNLRLENYTYEGQFFAKYRDPHGPLLTTYLGLPLKLGAAESETLFHSLYLIFPLIGAVSMYFLALRFTGRPLVATLLLISTPGFLVLSHTLMDNLPGLSLALAAAALYIAGVDRADFRLLSASGATMIVAALTAYQTLSLLPALAFYGLMTRPGGLGKRAMNLLPFALLIAGGAAWLVAAYRLYGRLPAISYRIRGQAYSWPGFGDDYGLQLRPLVTLLGGVSVFPLALMMAFLRRRLDLLAGFLSLILAALWVALSGTGGSDSSWLQAAAVVLLTWTGLMLLYKLIVSAFCRVGKEDLIVLRDGLFLLFWFASVLGVYLVIQIPYVSARHLLLLFPPIILLFINEAGKLFHGQPVRQNLVITAALVLTLAGGLAASAADYRSASIYPAAAAELRQELQPEADSGSTLYYRGEFGFRYYLEKQGFTALNDRTRMKTGDVVIYSMLSSPSNPWPQGTYVEISRLEPGDDFPFRIWNWWAGAGFYTNRMGPLPLAFSHDIEDRIIAYRFHE